MVQKVIERMSGNSFALKGWSITLVGSILALAASNGFASLSMAALMPAVMFWILDAFFLHQERLFRSLHEAIGKILRGDSSGPSVALWSMSTDPVRNQHPGWPRVAFTETLQAFHGMMTVLVLAVALARR